MALPLADLKILDLTWHVAGPYCTKLLADLGAQVIKIEQPQRGDPSRRAGPFPGDRPDPERSGTFLSLNTNKQGITLDLKAATGRGLFFELLQWADVVVENFTPGVMERLALDYARLQERRPQLVMTSISDFGQTGPSRQHHAPEMIAQAANGLMGSTGDHDREPIRYGQAQSQMMAGANAAWSTLAAWHYAEMTGQGQQIDVSIQETVIATFYHRLAMYAYTGISESRGLDDTMPCADGYVQPQRGPSVTWDSYVAFFGAPEPLLHPKFQTREGQQMYVDEIRASLIPQLMNRGRYEWFHDGQAMGMPFGLVQSLEEVANCPQLQAREFFQTVEHPAAGPLPHPSPPYRFDSGPFPLRPAPLLGQHNAAVYGDLLGHSRQELLQLTAMGIV